MCAGRHALRNAEGGIKALRTAQVCLKSWGRLGVASPCPLTVALRGGVIPRSIQGLIQAQKLPVNGSVTSIIKQEAVLLWGKECQTIERQLTAGS